MTVYMIVTRDKYRLPRWWGTTTAELAQLSGRKHQMERSIIPKELCEHIVDICEGGMMTCELG